MTDASDMLEALRDIERMAQTPADAVFMIATLIDGAAGWSDLGPLTITAHDGGDLTKINGRDVHLHELIGPIPAGPVALKS